MKNFAGETNYKLLLPLQEREPENTTQLQEQLERDRLISTISQRIHQATSLNETLNTAVLEVRKLLNCERALIYRFGWNRCGTVVQEAVLGDYPSLLGRSYSAEVLPQEYHQMYSQGRVGIISNIHQDQVSPCMVDFMQEFQAKAKLVVPIRQQEELWGLLVVHHCSTPRNWQLLEVNLLQELAIHIAIAIKQASLLEEAQTELQQRKLAEEKIQQLSSNVETSLSLLCATLDATADGILVVDNQGKIVSFNQRFVKMWQMPESVLEPRDYYQQVVFVKNQLKDPASFEQMVNKMYSQQDVETYEMLELNDGRYFERYTRPQFLAGKIVGIAISFRDITERKLAATALQKAHEQLETKVEERTAELKQTAEQLRHEIVERHWAEKALRESEERFRNLVESTSDWIWEIDNLSIYTYLSPQVYDLLGYQLSEIWGKTKFDLMPPADTSNSVKNLADLIEHHQPFICLENTFIHKDGTLLVLECSGIPFFDRDGQCQGYRGISRDITERKQAEAEIIKALEKEKLLCELKSRFVSTVSHEFRTPLSTILLATDLLINYDHKFDNTNKFKYFNQIQSQVYRMTQLMEDVLLIGKLQNSAVRFKPQLLDLKLFCEQILEEIVEGFGSNHRWELDLAGLSQNLFVEFDNRLMGQIINNLLTNAVKYSPKGTTIKFTVLSEQEQIILSICDQGIGIPHSEEAELFNEFHRCSNVDNVPGNGLGLSIVKKAIELHGGNIIVESEVGVGTTFTVCIPRIQLQTDSV
ncbi:MAG: PAS domain S-box protein [Crinalium sp.]